MSDYHEHDKLRKISDQSQVCGEFLEWLQGGHDSSPNPGLQLCIWREAPDLPRWVDERNGKPTSFASRHAVESPDWYPSGYYTPGKSTKDLLADFFGIDNEKIEQEKQAMLADLRERNAA